MEGIEKKKNNTKIQKPSNIIIALTSLGMDKHNKSILQKEHPDYRR